MNFDPDENDLRALYQGLKLQDEVHAPDLVHIVTRRRKVVRVRTTRSILALAAVFVLMATLISVLSEETANENVPTSASIETWRSPTDFLLRPPGGRYMSEIPELGKPLIHFNVKSNRENL